MSAEYADRTTGYDPEDTYGRHDLPGDYHDYAVGHSYSYGPQAYEHPSQQLSHRSRTPFPMAEYQYDHGEYDYPTGYTQPPVDEPDHDRYEDQFDRGVTEDGTPYRGADTNSVYGGTSHAGAYHGGYATPNQSHLSDVWTADEQHGRSWDRDRDHDSKGRPQLFGTIFCVLLLAGIGIACGAMLAVVFIRPPNVGIAGYTAPKIYLQDQNYFINTTVYAGVSNPNSIGAKVKHMRATFYQRNTSDHVLGTSLAKNLQVDSHSNTTLKVPVQFPLASNAANSNTQTLLTSMAQTCGWNLTQLLGDTGNNLVSHAPNADRSAHVFARASGTIPLSVHIDMKVSVMAVDFNSPVGNIDVDVACPDPGDFFGSGVTAGGTLGGSGTSSSGSVCATSLGASSVYCPTLTPSSSTYYIPTTSSSIYYSPTTSTTQPSTSVSVYPSTTVTSSSSSTSPIHTITVTHSPTPTSSYTPTVYTSSTTPTVTVQPTPTTTSRPTHTPKPTSSSQELPPPITETSTSHGDSGDSNAGADPWGGIWSFISAGSLPIRRAAPTSGPAA